MTIRGGIMERNEAGTEGFAASPPPGAQSEANEFSGSPTPSRSVQSDFTGSESTRPDGGAGQGLRDRAKNAIGSAGDRLADLGSTARERVGTAKGKLANALETGAERLRERGHRTGSSAGGATFAGATAEGSTAVSGDGPVAQISDRVAGGMDTTAEWLREADLDSLKSGIERQVKEHPGRTLLIALGLGYLIGRAFRNNQQ